MAAGPAKPSFGLCLSGRRRLGGGLSPWFGFILGGTLGLDFLRLKHAIRAEFSVGHGVGVVLKRVGQGVATRVDDFLPPALLAKHEFHAARAADNRSWLDISRHPKATVHGL